MKILLVCDDKNILDVISSKLLFLRKNDELISSSYSDAVKKLKITEFNAVLLYECTTKRSTIKLVEKIKKFENLSLILIPNSYNQDLITESFEKGIDDFILLNAPDYEFVVRIIKNLRDNSLKQAVFRDKKLLKNLKATDEYFVYKKHLAQFIIEDCIESLSTEHGAFMIIAPTVSAKSSFSQDKLVHAIKQSLRQTDIHTVGKGTQQCIYLPDTDMNGALLLFNRIKEKLDFEICTGISETENKSYEEFTLSAEQALTDALAEKSEFIFAQNVSEDTLNTWFDEAPSKNFKIFKQMFNKKLKNVIEPAFYRIQQIYNEKLTNTKIEQAVNEDACILRLKNKNKESSFKIIYPGFSKIIINISHSGLDSPENNIIHLKLSEITEKELVKIIENFIKEYKDE